MGSVPTSIQLELASLSNQPKGTDYNRIARKLYRQLPASDDEFVAMCDELVKSGQPGTFWFVNVWVKRRGSVYKLDYFPIYEKWLFNHATSWGKCDALCYRVLNPMLEKYPHLFTHNLSWTASTKTYVRRAAAVSMMQATGTFRVNVEWEKVEAVVKRLVADNHIHVQKGIGWLLKYSYLSYPERVEEYLRENVGNMTRTAFRYSLEKMPDTLRQQLMSL